MDSQLKVQIYDSTGSEWDRFPFMSTCYAKAENISLSSHTDGLVIKHQLFTGIIQSSSRIPSRSMLFFNDHDTLLNLA